MIHIVASDFLMPETSYDPFEQNEKFDLLQEDGEVYSRLFGICNVPISEEKTEVLMLRLLDRFIEGQGHECQNIKYLIHAYTAGDCVPPGHSIVRELGKRIGLSTRQSFGTNINKCVSVYSALKMAEAFLEQEEDGSSILIMTGDVGYTRDLRVIPNTSIGGDAVAALLVKKGKGRDAMLLNKQHVVGKYATGTWASREEAKDLEVNFIPLLVDLMMKNLEEARLSLEDLKWIVPHNINLPTWKKVAKHMGLKQNLFFLSNISKYAHCYNSDFIINHKTLVDEQLLQKGDYYLCAAAGVGTVFSTALFQY